MRFDWVQSGELEARAQLGPNLYAKLATADDRLVASLHQAGRMIAVANFRNVPEAEREISLWLRGIHPY